MRLKEFQQQLKKKGTDVVVLINDLERDDPNFVYLTQLRHVFGVLIIHQKKQPVLFTSSIDYGKVKKQGRIKNVKLMKKSFKKDLKKAAKGKVIGVNKKALTVAQFEFLKKNLKGKFVDASNEFAHVRLVKTTQEINRIKKACWFADKIMQKAIKFADKRKTELDVRRFIDLEIAKLGLEPSFPAIVASGKNSAVPHHGPGNQKLKGFVVMDMGVLYKNYCSDTTRTIYIGKPSKKERAMYEKVLKVQKECIQMLRGKASDPHKHAAKVLGKYFSHALGHGLGIEVHEDPVLSQVTKGVLEPGFVVTVEPGWYYGFGVRIEDDILIKKRGVEVLTKVSKRLITK